MANISIHILIVRSVYPGSAYYSVYCAVPLSLEKPRELDM